MSTKPILFSTPMVQAILDERKTMTRRVVKNQDGIHPRWNTIGWLGWDDGHGYKMRQPYDVGDVLWVREAWTRLIDVNGDLEYFYRADMENPTGHYKTAWHPSTRMPREAARLFLRVTDVRVEKLQSITDEDGKREGVCGLCYDVKTGEEKYDMTLFKVLWDGLNAKRGYGWDKNPWVWVYSFERCEKLEGWCE